VHADGLLPGEVLQVEVAPLDIVRMDVGVVYRLFGLKAEAQEDRHHHNAALVKRARAKLHRWH